MNQTTLSRLYPSEKYNGTRIFYSLIRSVIRIDMKILNLGCGPPSNNPIKILKGEAFRVVGADVDPDAVSNSEVDEVFIFDGIHLPFSDAEFDIVYCDYVMEHIEEPVLFLKEVKRVLKSSGYFFFRTPNKYHYTVLCSIIIPENLHYSVLKGVGRLDNSNKYYKTYYKFNSNTCVYSVLREAGFSDNSIKLDFVECEPSYLLFNKVLFWLGFLYERMVNRFRFLSFLRANIFGTVK